MNEIKFSVIVPIYNTEDYLTECIESVLCQTYKNFEILLIDDGSTDSSSIIAEQYAKKFPKFIKYIYQSNNGASAARNNGIKNASGDYILFLDSDDFWNDENALFLISKRIKITNPDILNYSYTKYYGNKTKPYFKKIKAAPLTNKIDRIEFITNNNLFIASPCNKAIKTSLLDSNLFFEEGVSSEDIVWCAKLILKTDNIDFVNLDFYFYRQNFYSTSHNINNKKLCDLSSNIIKCISISECATMLTKRLLLNYSAYQLATFVKIQSMTKICDLIFINKLKDYSYILKYHNKNIKVFILYTINSIIGFVNLCKLIKNMQKIKRI